MNPLDSSAGARLRKRIANGALMSFIGVYDVFSATLAAKHFDGIFASGFGFTASHYGLPDVGFISWQDMVGFVQRLRVVLPQVHLIVDIDDGYSDVEVACHVTHLLEAVGASGIIMEDQQRPKRCGHLDGKEIMPLGPFLTKLKRVLATRDRLFVVARTDSADPVDIQERVQAFDRVGADGVLVEGIKDLEIIRSIRNLVSCPIMFNQMAGGKSPSYTNSDLKEAGISLVNYSTPCLFAAQAAINEAMEGIQRCDGSLAGLNSKHVMLTDCHATLQENLARRQRP